MYSRNTLENLLNALGLTPAQRFWVGPEILTHHDTSPQGADPDNHLTIPTVCSTRDGGFPKFRGDKSPKSSRDDL